MRPLWQGLSLGVVAYLFFMLATAPAAKILSLVQPEGLRATAVAGSLWSGQAAQLALPPLQLNDVHWQIRPLLLFAGRLSFVVRGQLQGQRIKAHAGVSLLGNPQLSDVRGRVTAQDLMNLLGLRQVQPGGMLSFVIAEVAWPEAGYPALEGTVYWWPARINAPYSLDLGKMQLDTRIEDGVTRGTLNNEGGALSVQAEVEMHSDGAYRFDANLQQKGDVPQAVSRFLSTFAEFRDGTYRLEWSDTL